MTQELAKKVKLFEFFLTNDNWYKKSDYKIESKDEYTANLYIYDLTITFFHETDTIIVKDPEEIEQGLQIVTAKSMAEAMGYVIYKKEKADIIKLNKENKIKREKTK